MHDVLDYRVSSDRLERGWRLPTGFPIAWAWIVTMAVLGSLGLSVAVLVVLGDRAVSLPLQDRCPLGPFDEQSIAADARARQRIAALHPQGVYVVVSCSRSRLGVYHGDRLLREAVCSTGSGAVLIEPSGRRTWVFDSPIGERRVVGKAREPVWSKPDWAFIEEGFLPPRNPAYRVDTTSLGAYALYLGDGYIIHGTPFQTLLGRRITHGCIRLGDEDLEYVFRTVPVGSRVFIF